MKKKTDWLKHCKRFLKTGSTPSEQRDYAKEHLVNYNTFRKRLSAYKSSDSYKKSIAITETVHAKIRDGKPAPNSKSVPKSCQKITSGSARVATRVPSSNPGIKNNADGTRSFRPSNQVALLHGEFIRGGFRSRNYARRGQVSSAENLGLLKAQFATISDAAEELAIEIDERYDNGNPIILKEVNAQGKVTERELSKHQALIEVAIKAAIPMGEIHKIIQGSEEKLFNMEMRDREAPLYSADEKLEITRQILTERMNKKLTITETCNKFIFEGLTPPAILSRELEIEQRNAEPEPPKDDGVTADEASALKQILISNSKEAPDWLAKRRAENDRIYAELACVGDELITKNEE